MMRRRQQGIALVSVLVVVVIATVLAVSMVQEQKAAVDVTRSYLDRGQAMQYALGGEEIGRQMLFEDFEENSAVDHVAEPWASPDLSFEYDEGEVFVAITDLQGLVNLNALSPDNPAQNLSRQRFIFLLAAFGLEQELADRVADWVDEDTGTRPTGAEDFEYLAASPPYRAANAPFIHASELRLLGVNPETYGQLGPLVAALPSPEARLNINTAPAEVLQALSQGLSIEAAVTLAERRLESGGFETVESFRQAPELAGLGITGDGLGVQSGFFEIRTIARYRDRYSYLTSVVHRNPADGSMRIIQRDFSRNLQAQSASAGEPGDRGADRD